MDVRDVVKRILWGWLILILIVVLLGKITVAETNSGRTAADFLLIGVGARATGLGGAYTAISDGAVASYWNPSGLTSVKGGEVLLGHFAWYQDMTVEHGILAYQVNDRTTVAASIIYLNYGTIQNYDINGSYTGDISAYDWSGGVSLGYQVNDNVSVGVTGKFINQKIDDINGTTAAIDLGMKYSADRFALGAFLGNLGPKMTFENTSEDLPSSGRFGLMVYPFNKQFLTSVEIEKRFHGNTIIRQGFEVNYDNQYFIRTGYNYYPQDNDRAFSTGLSVGAGIKLNKAEFDYSYTPNDKYSSEDIHRLSLVFKFNK